MSENRQDLQSENFCRNVNWLRERQRIGVRELSRQIGVNKMTVSRICNSTHHPRVSIAILLSDFFAIDVNSLSIDHDEFVRKQEVDEKSMEFTQQD